MGRSVRIKMMLGFIVVASVILLVKNFAAGKELSPSTVVAETDSQAD